MNAIKRILVPVDFSPCADAAVEYAAFIAETFGAGIDVLHAWHPPHDMGAAFNFPVFDTKGGRQQTLLQFVKTQAGRDLKGVLSRLERRGLKDVRGRLEANTARMAILNATRGGDYDLVVMGTHGRTGLSHLFMGSVAEQVVRRSSVPVLTVRMPDDASEAKEEQRDRPAPPEHRAQPLQ